MILLFIGLVNSFKYPYACDCSEHLNKEACQDHKCYWEETKCRPLECYERQATIDGCINSSQF